MKKSKMTVLEKCFRKAAKLHGIKLKKDIVADLGYVLKGNLGEIELTYKIQYKKSENQSPEEKRARSDIRSMLGISESEINKKKKQKNKFPIAQADISKIFSDDSDDSDEHFNSDRFWIRKDGIFYYSTLDLKKFNERYTQSFKSGIMQLIHKELNKLGLSGLGLGVSISGNMNLKTESADKYFHAVIEFFKGCATA